MNIKNEIEKAVKHLIANDAQPYLENEIESICSRVYQDVMNSAYDFEKSECIILNQGDKKRLVKRFPNLSNESILCQVIKQVLDRDFNIIYPNRNKISKMLFQTLVAVKQMSDFTIYKFDFKDFFNSLSSDYIYRKCLVPSITDRKMGGIIEEFCLKTKYAYAGFQTSNAMAEIIAKRFDEEIKKIYYNQGLVFYERYIDDGLLILNRYIPKDKLEEIFSSVLSDVFFDNDIDSACVCKTKYNSTKCNYLSSHSLSQVPGASFNFLGYEFWLKKDLGKTSIQYGITNEKMKKYCERLDSIIKLYNDANSADYGNEELLRHRILAFSCRTVYMRMIFRSSVWKVKGFISNYGELRFLLDSPQIHPDTKSFLLDAIENAFKKAGLMPYFIKGAPNSVAGYNLFHNMKNNKTILLVDKIGYNYDSLVKLCKSIGVSTIDGNGKKRKYSALVRDYLIKIKVGY